MSELNVTSEMFFEWKQNPVTQEIFTVLEERREKYLSEILNGETLMTDKALQVTGINIGRISAIDEILSLTPIEESDHDA